MASKLEHKYRYVWFDDDGRACGTNDKKTAFHFDDDHEVIDVHKGELLGSGEVLFEAEMPEEDDDKDEEE